MQQAGYKSYGFEELEVGMEATYTRTLTASDITTFADVSGDTNPLHLDPAYAAPIRATLTSILQDCIDFARKP